MSAARAKKKPQEEFNLFDALKMLEKEKGIPVDYMIEKIIFLHNFQAENNKE